MNTNCAIDLVSPERIQRIRELAQKATPGPWELTGIPDVTDILTANTRNVICSPHRLRDATYIAAVHPGVLLAMCEEIERLREQVALLNKEAEWLAEHMPKTSMIDGKARVQCLRGMQEWRETARKAVEAGHHE